jgi:hypothetical protein
MEPLKNILKIYKDKNKVFQEYLDEKTLKKINNCIYFDENEKDLYLDDNVSFVTKNTGKFYKKGKIIAIENTKITIKTNNNYLNLDKDEYYLFIKERKNKKSDRDFYKALLNELK